MLNKKNFTKLIVLGLLGVSLLRFAPEVKAEANDGFTKSSYGYNMKRLEGSDRFETAIAVSNEFKRLSDKNNEKVENVVLANAFDYPDSIASAPLSKIYNAPLLLTEKDKLNSKTEVQLKKLKIKKVFIVGGVGVVSQNVENKLKSMGITVERLAGENRYQTSLKIANKVLDYRLANAPTNSLGYKYRSIFLVDGYRYTDALTLAGMSGRNDTPIVLLPSNEDLKPSDVKGLNELISKATEGENDKEIPIEKLKIYWFLPYFNDNFFENVPNCSMQGSTKNKYMANLTLNWANQAILNSNNVMIATGENFPDALAGGALAAKLNIPIVFTGDTFKETYKDLGNAKEIIKKETELYRDTKNVYPVGGKAIVKDGAEKKLKGVD
ncbi:cell wall binding repeat 2 family protein [Clostridium argentinense CDC 2741]|uniref:Cell wall binding repeat 2 family protein n=1 Tax=Clostridium argentinense CDC 2741 TaxID=1418104 RepID=A0A0C1R448_9CLOT|nr:cell wall-binding repeat-containing protein [Clostridium argentinense]ARC84441.1 cell wall-binding repeat 2 family protein [Clostridium argentinense]KIE45276.1 cell wall binding repeat 2 family protein [Clostridium argentinense CDC 2741]NFF38776.1 cell wall-binding repeat-containing protein [Clostridium argentinense]NFP49001.1 cell wall-binding repeat-containing protein [Clostridium argentinense]NFP72543.1 cell wall-binding repeat-containing protein [Clostridium argentinense]